MSSFPASPTLYVPSDEERTYALLSHILGIISGFIAPLVFFLMKRDSKFVSFHALQGLLWHAIYLALVLAGIILAFVAFFLTAGFHALENNKEPPVAFLVLFGAVWLGAMAGGILNLILGIVYGVKAQKGEWARYPLIGQWVFNKVVINS